MRVEREEADRIFELTSKGVGTFEFPDGSRYDGGWKMEQSTSPTGELVVGAKRRHGFGRYWNGNEELSGTWASFRGAASTFSAPAAGLTASICRATKRNRCRRRLLRAISAVIDDASSAPI